MSSDEDQNIFSSSTSWASPSAHAMSAQLSAKRRSLDPSAAHFAAWNSNLEGGLVRAASGLKFVMNTLGIGRGVIASSPIDTL